MDLDRRVDPRTDLDYSLRNLLRTRAQRHDYLVAVLTTHDGLLLAASRGESTQPGGGETRRLAERAAAHASTETPLVDGGSGVRLVNKRFDVDGQPLLLAVLRPGASSERDAPILDDMARRVAKIFSERRAAAAA